MHPPGPVPVCWWPSALPFARLLLGKTTTCSRFISYWWFGTKWRRQILCIGAVITLLRIIPIYSVGAEVVAIMRQNAPFVDLVKSPKAVFIEILREHALFCDIIINSGSTCFRSLSFHIKLGKHLLSLFCHFQISTTSYCPNSADL